MEQICSWANISEEMRSYHDNEWCIPSNDDQYLFEMLVLEGAQAGLSWSTVLKKRNEYRRVFDNFNISYCANLTDSDIDYNLNNSEIIRHPLKIKSVRSNALSVLAIQKESGSFSDYLWSYVEHEPIVSNWVYESQMPSQTELSVKISKDLMKKGFKFVGPTIIYSYMQAIGMINDHVVACPFHSTKKKK